MIKYYHLTGGTVNSKYTIGWNVTESNSERFRMNLPDRRSVLLSYFVSSQLMARMFPIDSRKAAMSLTVVSCPMRRVNS